MQFAPWGVVHDDLYQSPRRLRAHPLTKGPPSIEGAKGPKGVREVDHEVPYLLPPHSEALSAISYSVGICAPSLGEEFGTQPLGLVRFGLLQEQDP